MNEKNGNIDLNNLYDVIIIGGGPAGLTAALYLARARYRVLVLEKEQFGGQITITSEVVNYPGVERTSGTALTETIRRQAAHFGAEFLLTEATSLLLDSEIKSVTTIRGTFHCFGVLLATGAHPRMVGFQGEQEFKGRGVAYCATCDGEFFTGKEVFVIGGGFAAAEESVFLTKYASHVTILIREEDFTCAKATAEGARSHPKITVLTNTVVEEVLGDTALRSLRYRNLKTGEPTVYHAGEGETFGVFVFAGYEPATGLVKGLLDLNEQGYIITDPSLQTSLPGVYAAGDVCIKPLRQVVTAVGDGALAATELEKVAAGCQRRTGLHPARPADLTEKRADTDRSDTGNGLTLGLASGTASQTSGGLASHADSGLVSELFDADMLSQLQTVFARMEAPLTLKLYLNDNPVSSELKAYMEALTALTDKLSLVISNEISVADETVLPEELPCVRICDRNGHYTGLAFHGVPGGHEFTSFVLGLYNAAGSGQTIAEDTAAAIRSIAAPISLRVLVSLSCTMCPELVTSAQKIAALNPQVTADVYDLNHFPALKERYQVMSVPCLIINDTQVSFGKKNLPKLLEILGAL